MITAIEIQNFKAIGQDRQRIELKPITLLFGPNSAGKSTIIHALHYAREVLERRNLDADHTVAGGPFVDLGGFKNFIHNHDLRNAVTLSFEIARTDKSHFLLSQVGQWQAYEGVAGEVTERLSDIAACGVEITISWSSIFNRPFVSRYAVSIDGKSLARIEATGDKPGAKLAGLNLEHPIFGPPFEGSEAPWGRDDEALNVETIWRRGLLEIAGQDGSRVLPIPTQGDALPIFDEDLALDLTGQGEEEAKKWLGGPDGTTTLATINLLSCLVVGPGQRLRDELDSMRYIGPLRQTPPRHFEPPLTPEPGRWATGLAAWDHLKSADENFIELVSDWMVSDTEDGKLDTGYSLRRQTYAELDLASPLAVLLSSPRALRENIDDLALQISSLPRRARLLLVDKNHPQLSVEPDDVGEGVAQIVPVVVAALDQDCKFLVIEQPELHVHPRIQVALGDLFIQRMVVNQVISRLTPERPFNAVSLIETHSEHLLLRILRRIKETGANELPEGVAGLKPDDVTICYVEPGPSGAKLTPLPVDASGEFLVNWPSGFFEERAKELFG